MEQTEALVIGGGPAGLMAAETLGRAGHRVILAEAMPTPGRKLLMAGKSGLNLTKAEDAEVFQACFRGAAAWLRPALDTFGPDAVQDWARELGQQVFTGSTGRVFPIAMKASPLLRAWVARLADLRVEIRTGWRWTGWQGRACQFETAEGPRSVTARSVVLGLGGASWRRLGSDGAWAGTLSEWNVPVAPFAPSNAGLAITWSDRMTPFFGTPVKGIALSAGEIRSRGEVVLSVRGIEGGGIYPLSPALRQGAVLMLDLAPDRSLDDLTERLSRSLGRPGGGKTSLSNHLRRSVKLNAVARALLTEFARPLPSEPGALAGAIKAVRVADDGLRPMDEAISTAGGVTQLAVDEHFMLRALPGVFCAGEMLDWEAPTGGYLITASLATGRAAGAGAMAWLAGEGSGGGG